jgi:tRNA(fMet)-specific endonuclease VapC
MKFMLDTDSVSYALRGEGLIGEKILEHLPSELCVSALTVAELRFGAERRQSRKLHRLIDAFLSSVAAVPFEEETARTYGKVAALLAERGTPIGQLDTMIASHALHLGLTVVTRNVAYFGAVPRLRVVSWYD